MLRLFTAIKISPGEKMLKAIDDCRKELVQENIKWVNPSNIHITLKFFGDTPEKQISKIVDVFLRASQEFKTFKMEIVSCGTFGSPGFPRVIWFGLEAGEKLEGLYNVINKVLLPLGYEPDKRGFSPHLTIGRVKHIKNLYLLDSMISKYTDEHFMSINVDEFQLFQSVLQKEGPKYIIIERFKL